MNEKKLLNLVFGGYSVIDWSDLFFSTDDEAAAFIRLNEFDLSRQKDLDRLLAIHNESVGTYRGSSVTTSQRNWRNRHWIWFDC